MASVSLTSHLAAYSNDTHFTVDATDVLNSLEQVFAKEEALRNAG
jgi:hypothetical protein